MAYVGLRKPMASKANIDPSTGAITYDTSKVVAWGKAVSFSDTPNVSNVELYGDDVLAESEKGVMSSALELGTTDTPDDLKVAMFGHTKTDNEYAYNVDDEAYYCGFGVLGVKKVDGVRAFEAKFYPKTQWQEPTVNYSTRGESTEFTTPSTTGTALPDKNGDWKFEETFTGATAEADAIDWLEGKFGL